MQRVQYIRGFLLLNILICMQMYLTGAEEATVIRNSKLCYDSPSLEGVVYSYHNATKSCFRIGTRGPCGDSMVFYLDPQNPDIGQCDCDISSRCTRPMVYWKAQNRCYRIFDQGPCASGEWLSLQFGRRPVCEKDPCVRSHSEFESTNPNEFWIQYSGQCVLTGSQGVCRYSNEKILINGFSRTPSPICSAVTFNCILPSMPSLVCVPGQKWHQDGCDPEHVVIATETSTYSPVITLPMHYPHDHHHHHHFHHPHHHHGRHNPHSNDFESAESRFHHHGYRHHHYYNRFHPNNSTASLLTTRRAPLPTLPNRFTSEASPTTTVSWARTTRRSLLASRAIPHGLPMVPSRTTQPPVPVIIDIRRVLRS